MQLLLCMFLICDMKPLEPPEYVVIYTDADLADIVHINGLYHGHSCFTIGMDGLVLATGSYITSDTSLTEIL